MLKAVIAATAAIAIAGSSAAYAQKVADRGSDRADRRGQSVDDIRAFQAARLAALRAGLTLTPEQQKLWPAYETAIRELQELRLTRQNAQRDGKAGQSAEQQAGANDQKAGANDQQAANPAERLRQRAVRLSEDGAALQKLAAAMEPLYASFDEAQQRRFTILSRVDRPQFNNQRGGNGTQPGQRRGDAGDNQDAANIKTVGKKVQGANNQDADTESDNANTNTNTANNNNKVVKKANGAATGDASGPASPIAFVGKLLVDPAFEVLPAPATDGKSASPKTI
jgi:hypothetical protein